VSLRVHSGSGPNYRNQFKRMFGQRGFDGLMSAMREKQQELRQSIGA
jgi:hypothetical protein